MSETYTNRASSSSGCLYKSRVLLLVLLLACLRVRVPMLNTLQVVNYGIGGHYNYHEDYLFKTERAKKVRWAVG